MKRINGSNRSRWNLGIGIGGSLGALLVAGLLFLQPSPAQAQTTFAQTDLTGTWRIHSLMTPKKAKWGGGWALGDITVDAAGAVTGGTLTFPQAMLPVALTGGSLTVDSGGAVTGSVTFSDGNSAMLTQTMVPSKDQAWGVMTNRDPAGNANLSMLATLVKVTSTAFTQADLTGTWRSYRLLIQPNFDNGSEGTWAKGTHTLDSLGVLTSGSLTFADASVASLDAGLFSVDAAGVITGTDATSAGSISRAYSGTMVPSKDQFVTVVTETDGVSNLLLRLALTVFVKQGGTTFAQADLDSGWYFHGLHSAGVSSDDGGGWATGTLPITGTGTVTAGRIFIDDGRLLPTTTSVALSIDAAGAITGTLSAIDPVEGTLSIPVEASMIPSKDQIVGVYAKGGDLGMFTQVQDASALPSLVVLKIGPGAGDVTSNPFGVNCVNGGDDCAESYAGGTSITLTAAATGGSTLFGGWGGCDATAGTSCTLTLNSSRVVSAGFGPRIGVDFLHSANGGSFGAGVTPTPSFPVTINGYTARAKVDVDSSFPAASQVFFTGPSGSGLSNTAAANAAIQATEARYDSPTVTSPLTAPGGTWTVDYRGTPWSFDVPDPQTSARLAIPVPTVTVAGDVVQSVSWVYQDATDGTVLSTPDFMADIQVQIDSPCGRVYDSPLNVSPTTTSDTLTAAVYWSEVVRVRMAYNDTLGNQYVVSYDKTSATVCGAPAITSPTPGSTFTGTSATFTWTGNGTALTTWWFFVGTTGVGSSNLYNSGSLGASLSTTVSGLPTNGSTLYVRLWYLVSGVWQWLDYQYTAHSIPELTSPTPGSQFSSDTETFTWTPYGAAVTDWMLQVGTSLGASDLHDSGLLPSTTLSTTVAGLPRDGSSTLYVRLWYMIGGVWQSPDYQYISAIGPPAITAPTPSSTLSAATETFTWVNNGTTVDQYFLYVGTTGVGSLDIFANGFANTVFSTAVSGIPTNGSTVYVRLWYMVGGVWQFVDYQYTAVTIPAITAPFPGSTLTGATETFFWTAYGLAVTDWMLDIGTSVGASDLHNSGSLGGATLSRTVTGLPIDGSTLYVRLSYLIGGVWQNVDYQYTAFLPPPAITAPVPGSTFSGATETFTWTDNGTTVDQYFFYVGTTGVGSLDIYSAGFANTVFSTTVSGIPTNGSTIYLRLWYMIGGIWQWADYTYTAAIIATPPAITSPVPGTQLAGTTQLFTWTNNFTPVTNWMLHVGTSLGASDIHNSGTLPSTTLSWTVAGLPNDGSTLFVRLWSLEGGVWKFVDYTYLASAPPPAITAPVPGSTLSGPTEIFTWSNNGTLVDMYFLDVGSTGVGSWDIYSSGFANTVFSTTVTGLPTNGTTVYVRLWYVIGGFWQFTDYTYTAAIVATPPAITAPIPGSTLTGTTVTFTWTANFSPVTEYMLDVGTSVGASDLHASGSLASTTLSRMVTGLPNDGSTVHVRLWSRIGGVWQTADYTYTAFSLPPGITAPVPGSTLSGTTETFTWTDNGTTVDQYWFYVGTLGVGSLDIYGADQGLNLSTTVSGLPTGGVTLYVRLWYMIGGVWQFTDYTYTAAP